MVPPLGSGWFENDEPLDAKRELFLERLRVLAARWSWSTAPHTYAFPRQATGALDLAVDVLGRDGEPVVVTLAIPLRERLRSVLDRPQAGFFVGRLAYGA
jgi:hypothetical protein